MSMAIAQRGVKVVRCAYIMHDGQPCGVEFKQHIRGQRNCTKHTHRNVVMIGKARAGVRLTAQGQITEQGRAEV